jgi:hypothetical protein
LVIRIAVTNSNATTAQYAAIADVAGVGSTASLPTTTVLPNIPLTNITQVGAGSTVVMNLGVNGFHSSGSCAVVGLATVNANPPTYCANDMTFVAYVSTISTTGA